MELQKNSSNSQSIDIVLHAVASSGVKEQVARELEIPDNTFARFIQSSQMGAVHFRFEPVDE